MRLWSAIKETPGQTKQSIVFTEGVTFTVKAPAAQVFHTIVDFPNYRLWNTWSPCFDFGGDGELTVGSEGILSAIALKRDYKLPVKVGYGS